MPLIHKKTPAAFKKNIEIEMKHGKPQKQAVAIAYSEKERAEHKKHLADGGKVHGCVNCYPTGGAVKAFYKYQEPNQYQPKTSSDDDGIPAQKNHKPDIPVQSSGPVEDASPIKGRDLDEEKSQNWANEYKGGKIELKDHEREDKPKPTGTLESYHETGRNKPVGMMQREQDLKDFKRSEGPKLKGLAYGGQVEHMKAPVRDSLIDMVHKSMESDGIEPGEADKQMAHEHARKMGIDLKEHEAEHAAESYAHGGEAKEEMHNPEHEDEEEDKELIDHEIHEGLGKELMEAMEGKDHKRMMECIEACVLSCMNKGGK